MGSHGGSEAGRAAPFALVPTAWSEPVGPIVGVPEMHDTLRSWLTETGLELRPHAPA
jgi:hypothetical protein